MQATETDIEILTKLQNVDRDLLRARKEFQALPQRQQILDARTKLAEVGKRKVQVQDMLDGCEDQLSAYAAEDERLAAEQKGTEEALEQARGDYRVVEANSRKLNGINKRRTTIVEELGRIEDQTRKIAPVMEQVRQAIAGLEAQEARLIASFREEGGALQQRIAQLEALRASLLEGGIDPAVLKEYDAALERCGGVALCVMREDTCSACRNHFDTGKRSLVRSQAPLAHCPYCNRLMIVSD